MLNKEKIKSLKAIYPKETRLLLEKMQGENDMPTGLRGTVCLVDDIGQIHMNWDNGRSLAINPEIDTYRKLTQRELEEETQ